MIVPTEDEFASWRLHPCSQFVAAAYAAAAERQRAEWMKCFNSPTVDLAAKRLELQTREDAYRAFTETTLVDFIALADPETNRRPSPRLSRARP